MQQIIISALVQLYVGYRVCVHWIKQIIDQYVVRVFRKLAVAIEDVIGKAAQQYQQKQEAEVLLLLKKREEEWRKERLPYLQQLTRSHSGTNMHYFYQKIQTSDPLLAIAERLVHSGHTLSDRLDHDIERTLLERVYGKVTDILKGGI